MAKPTIVTRASKGTALTWTEGDSNFTNLRDATLSVTDGTNTKALNLNDTLTFTAGTNITLSVNATTGAVTINNSQTAFDPASPGAIGGTTPAAITSTTHTISAANELRFNNTANTFYVGFKAPSLTASKIWTLPTADGTANYVLTTNGSGVLSWSAPSVTSVTLNDSSSNAQYFTLQQSGATSGSYTNYTASGVYFIPSTNTLYTTNLSASIYKGNSETTNTDFQIAFLTSTGNYDYPRINSNLTANPSTGTITATKFAGAHNGTVGATTPAAGTFTTLTATGTTTLATSLGGILKATAGVISAATAGTDYVAISGALGTPSSGTVTNLTGTASININGTVGATTPTTGAFTTLSATSTVSGTGFSTYLASPPAIGSTTASTGRFTTITSTNIASGLLKATTGVISAATAGTDYLAPPNGTALLKGNAGGPLANATAGTDYVAPGGALGTPSSGTVTNLTGTASININGTVGATTPSTGKFTSLTLTGQFNEAVYTAGATTGTITPDCANGTTQKITLTGSITFNAFANPVAGQSMTLIIKQSATGSLTLTSTMLFSGASKTLSTAANAIDILTVFYDGTSYYASLGKGFA